MGIRDRHTFLHAGATGSAGNNQRAVMFIRIFRRRNDSFAHGRSHRTANNREIPCSTNRINSADFAGTDLNRVVISGFLTIYFQTVNIFLGIFKLKRIFLHGRQSHFSINAVSYTHLNIIGGSKQLFCKFEDPVK